MNQAKIDNTKLLNIKSSPIEAVNYVNDFLQG